MPDEVGGVADNTRNQDLSGPRKRFASPFLSLGQLSKLAKPDTNPYFNSKFEINKTVHKQAEWRKNLAAPQ